MKQLSPTQAIVIVGAIQFVYLLDFIMLLPLGPDLARALAFSSDKLGWLSAAYTSAAVLSGLLSVRLLDRYDRRSVLLLAFGAVGLCTLAATFASGLWTLMLARALTGLCGGPAIALGMALIIDSTPPERRGRAIGKVMLGFSAAVIAGVPMALELARWGGWRLPFYAVAAMAALVWLLAAVRLPSLRNHLEPDRRHAVSARSLLARPAVRAACLMQALSQFSAFLVIPQFSAYLLLNLGFPRERLGMLYFAGGVAALVTVQLLGRLADRAGALPAAAIATLAFCAGLAPFFNLGALPLVLPFILFMAGNAGRNVTLAAITSQVPAPHERAGFMSLQNIVQDLAISAAALSSSLLLGQRADGGLTGMDTVALLSAGLSVMVLAALLRLRWRLPLAQLRRQ
ncbi:MFS transporter [Janthinobacterium agaricidamnosum]|uniref:Major Facilitator Superfamily protein n=1 Tax=Janthinobacterium agaricidamnosum NBRC 102515 = DSM 9628 TaxID=1349767 RepID=W0V8X1_9BURK|nr:MFS transporter [Janthinobacterium agaricidamnosum]CDG83722.1 major Facilitator Superfamily protein [Janthinobacterium agaricidamnosum NBRC 102515 = DSM 9628]